MKYCKKCGNKMVDDAVVCVKCGCYVDKNLSQEGGEQFCAYCGFPLSVSTDVCVRCGTPVLKNTKTLKSYSTGMVTVIKVFLTLACVFKIAAAHVCLLWMLPMTISLFKKMNKSEPIGVGFKVCTLIFVSFIAGILLLCLGDPKEKE